jgi:hypothetical protein
MNPRQGRTLPLSPPRRVVNDLMYFCRGVPSIPMARRMNLTSVVRARRAVLPRPGWCAIFLKAFALVANRHPEFRRAYLTFPWPHLYEHPGNVATVTIERRLGDEEGVFFAYLRDPEQWKLTDIDNCLRFCKEEPLERIASFRRSLRVGRLPRPLRRLLMWVGLNVSGRQRARCFGTFGVTVTAGLGAGPLFIPSPLAATLSYGLFQPDGSLDVLLAFDHRVTDGGAAARALRELEEVLQHDLLTELRSLQVWRKPDAPLPFFPPVGQLPLGEEESPGLQGVDHGAQ